MSRITTTGKGMAAAIGVAAARKAAGGVGAVRRRAVFGTPARSGGRRDVHVVTVDVAPDLLAPGTPPLEPLRVFGDAVEVTVRPAPKDRGSELVARMVHGLGSRAGDEDPHDAVRRALREAKALAEVGFVLSPDRPTTTEPTPLNAPLREATAHGRGAGRL